MWSIPPRPSFLPVLLLLLVACGSAPDAGTGETAEVAATSGTAATAPAAPEAAAAPQVAPVGEYECYFHGDYGLQNSSMTVLRIHGPAEYEAMEERGRYAAADGTLRMEGGPLAGRVARMRESSGKPAIVFLRRDNEVDGRPTIDISDTWCYFEPR